MFTEKSEMTPDLIINFEEEVKNPANIATRNLTIFSKIMFNKIANP